MKPFKQADQWFMAWWPKQGRLLFLVLNLAAAALNLWLFYFSRHWLSLVTAFFNLGGAVFLLWSSLSDKGKKRRGGLEVLSEP
mgnify:FL=1